MRRGMEPAIVRGEDGRVTGLFLSADFTAEHEWGIDRIKRDFGIDPKAPPGIDRRRVRDAHPKNLHLFETKDYSVLLGIGGLQGVEIERARANPGATGNHFEVQVDKREFARRFDLSIEEYGPKDKTKTKEIAGAWCGESFGVMVPSRNAAILREVYEAFLEGDGAIFIGWQRLPVFDNGGLVLAIVGRIPQDSLDKMRASDEDRDALLKASDATGILQRIEQHNVGKDWRDPSRCAFFACSPSWASGLRSVIRYGEPNNQTALKTKYDVVYFLNPQGQDKHNSGYFTVEELDEWLAGRGPVMMTPKQRAAAR
jgi:hypothetical protein